VGLEIMFHVWLMNAGICFLWVTIKILQLPKWFKQIQAVLCSYCPSVEDPFVIQSTGSSHSALLQAVTKTSARHAFLSFRFSREAQVAHA